MNILDEAYEAYFSLLDEYFRGIYTPGIDKNTQASYIAHMTKAAQVVLLSFDDIAQDISAFWNKYAASVLSFIRDENAFKALYCGQISPLEGQQFVKRTAMYVDSILIEDPITNIVNLKDLSTDNMYLVRMIRHAFNLMDLRELFFGQGNFPILTIFPYFLDEDTRQEIRKEVDKNGLAYFSELLEVDYTDIDDFFDFLKAFKEPEKLSNKIRRPELLPKDENQSAHDFIIEVYQSALKSRKDIQGITVGTTLGQKILGQFMGLGIESFQSKYLHSQQVFDSKYYWEMFRWNIRNQQNNIDDLLINSLNLQQFNWLGNIPIEKLILLRREGELSKIREILRRNIYSCTHSTSSLDTVADQAIKNIEDSLNEHNAQVAEIGKSIKKKYLIDGPIIIVGLLAGVFSGPLLPLTITGLASTVYGGYDLVKSISSADKEKKELESGVFSMLLSARNKG